VTGKNEEGIVKVLALNTAEEVDVFYQQRGKTNLAEGTGVLNFVYSLILTRGLQTTKDDMDDFEVCSRV